MRAAATVALGLIGAYLALTLAAAAEMTPNAAERASCEAQGGCEIVSNAWLRAQSRAAFDLGFKTGAETAAKEAAPCRKTPTT